MAWKVFDIKILKISMNLLNLLSNYSYWEVCSHRHCVFTISLSIDFKQYRFMPTIIALFQYSRMRHREKDNGSRTGVFTDNQITSQHFTNKTNTMTCRCNNKQHIHFPSWCSWTDITEYNCVHIILLHQECQPYIYIKLSRTRTAQCNDSTFM